MHQSLTLCFVNLLALVLTTLGSVSGVAHTGVGSRISEQSLQSVLSKNSEGQELLAALPEFFPELSAESPVGAILSEEFYKRARVVRLTESPLAKPLSELLRKQLSLSKIPMSMTPEEIQFLDQNPNDKIFSAIDKVDFQGFVSNPGTIMYRLHTENMHLVFDFVKFYDSEMKRMPPSDRFMQLKNLGFTGMTKANAAVRAYLMGPRKLINLDALKLSYATRAQLTAAKIEGKVTEDQLKMAPLDLFTLTEIGIAHIESESHQKPRIQSACHRMLVIMNSGKL